MIKKPKELSIYIHWPFCKTKCPYCDFNSHENTIINHDIWEEAFLKEIEFKKELISDRTIISVFFGGGTPSLMKPKTINLILKQLNSLAEFCKNIEITLEANPNSIDRENFYNFKSSGINRVSIGIQSFYSKNLKFLGRSHSSYDALKALEIARTIFNNYSFDLMYCLPNQKVIEWEEELNKAIKYIDHHVSCYQLTIEKGTQFFQDFRSNMFRMPKESIAVQMYTLTSDILESHGINQYEISNYSKFGYESKHNINYWKLNDYIGIGPGAHGRYCYDNGIYSTINYYDPQKWYKYLVNNKLPHQSKRKLTENEQLLDKLTMGLRLNKGIDQSYITNSHVIKDLVNDGFLKVGIDNLISCTIKGRLVLNYLIERLI